MINLSVVEQGLKQVMANQVTAKNGLGFVKSKRMAGNLMMA